MILSPDGAACSRRAPPIYVVWVVGALIWFTIQAVTGVNGQRPRVNKECLRHCTWLAPRLCIAIWGVLGRPPLWCDETLIGCTCPASTDATPTCPGTATSCTPMTPTCGPWSWPPGPWLGPWPSTGSGATPWFAWSTGSTAGGTCLWASVFVTQLSVHNLHCICGLGRGMSSLASPYRGRSSQLLPHPFRIAIPEILSYLICVIFAQMSQSVAGQKLLEHIVIFFLIWLSLNL